MICLRGQLQRSSSSDDTPKWTWTGVWAFGSTIDSSQQEAGLPYAYQFSHPIEPTTTTTTTTNTSEHQEKTLVAKRTSKALKQKQLTILPPPPPVITNALLEKQKDAVTDVTAVVLEASKPGDGNNDPAVKVVNDEFPTPKPPAGGGAAAVPFLDAKTIIIPTPITAATTTFPITVPTTHRSSVAATTTTPIATTQTQQQKQQSSIETPKAAKSTDTPIPTRPVAVTTTIPTTATTANALPPLSISATVQNEALAAVGFSQSSSLSSSATTAPITTTTAGSTINDLNEAPTTGAAGSTTTTAASTNKTPTTAAATPTTIIAVDAAATTTANNNKAPLEFQFQNYTLPVSGVWKGTFEAMMPSSSRNNTNSMGDQLTTIPEEFTMEWNPNNLKDDDKTTTTASATTTTTRILLRVTGTGQNQFGNFTLVGTLELGDGITSTTNSTMILQCHREYVIAPPPPPRISYQTRKRQLSWKRRDVYDEPAAVTNTTVPPAAGGATTAKSVSLRKPSGPSTKKVKLATNPTTITTPSDMLTIQIPVALPLGTTKRITASTTGTTLPSVPDAYNARWRSAHFLYYQAPTDTTNESPMYVVYEGEMVHSMRDGRGVCLYNNGLLYEGEWKDDREHGHGTLQTADRKSIIYQGEWERGRMHGRGIYYYPDAGAAAKGGKSELDPPKHFYQGEFRENLRNGTGHYQLSDGSTYSGSWRDGAMSGRGVFTWPDGSVYDGDWKDNKRHGNGILQASDGFTYDGAWVRNSMDGRGSATYKNQQEYHGMWSRGRREGRGTILFTNGAVYEGRFRDDAIDGQGTLKIANTLLVPKVNEIENKDKIKSDFMIPLSFQSDLARIHQKAGFSSAGQ